MERTHRKPTGGSIASRRCDLCYQYFHPEETHKFPPHKLRSTSCRLCWNCIEQIRDLLKTLAGDEDRREARNAAA